VVEYLRVFRHVGFFRSLLVLFTNMAIDPICGMSVDEAFALRAGRDGKTFYFCSSRCRETFLSTPATANRNEKPNADAIYTCPMHPEVEHDRPGDCPKCGMRLEPKTLKASTGGNEDNELRKMTARFWLGAVLTMPVFLLAMAHMVPLLAGQSWLNGGLLLSPVLAGAAMSLSSVSVIANALRLRKVKL